MSLLFTINQDLKAALKAREVARVSVLRFILAQIQNRAIEKRGRGEGEELNNEEVIAVLRGELKKRKEAIELFRKGSRDDLVSKEEAELKYFEGYLPKLLSREEVEKVVQGVVDQGLGEFGLVMKTVMSEVGAKADGRLISEVVREKLSK